MKLDSIGARGGRRGLILLAGGIIFVTSLLAVTVNSLSYGFHWDYTISRYVGLETWSAIIFGLGNLVVILLSGKFLWWLQEKWHLPRFLMGVLIAFYALGLLLLSIFPAGYFDQPGAAYGSSWQSLIHNRAARVMFMSMLMMVATLAVWGSMSQKMRVLATLYVLYGVFCAAVFLMKVDWFGQWILAFESCYIFGFFGICCGCRVRSKNRCEVLEESGSSNESKGGALAAILPEKSKLERRENGRAKSRE